MRQICEKQRLARPDRFFCQMVRERAYSWMDISASPAKSEQDFDDDDDDDYYEEEDEGYEDDLIRAWKRAGFHMNDDGDMEYNDDVDLQEMETEEW